MKQRWQAGDEIAGHSLTHQVMSTKFPTTEEEIIGSVSYTHLTLPTIYSV